MLLEFHLIEESKPKTFIFDETYQLERRQQSTSGSQG